MVNRIALRPVSTDDDELIYTLYALSRPDLEWIINVDSDTKTLLIQTQLQMEQAFLESEYPDAQKSIVLFEGLPVGRFYIYSCDNFIRIIAISILPEYRRKGIGSCLLSTILKDATESGKYVCLSVMWFNTLARSLYERLGFYVVDNEGVRCEMRWTPT